MDRIEYLAELEKDLNDVIVLMVKNRDYGERLKKIIELRGEIFSEFEETKDHLTNESELVSERRMFEIAEQISPFFRISKRNCSRKVKR